MPRVSCRLPRQAQECFEVLRRTHPLSGFSRGGRGRRHDRPGSPGMPGDIVSRPGMAEPAATT